MSREYTGNELSDPGVYPKRYLLVDLSDSSVRERASEIEKLIVVETLFSSLKTFINVINFILNKLLPISLGFLFTLLLYTIFTFLTTPGVIPPHFYPGADLTGVLGYLLSLVDGLVKGFQELVSRQNLFFFWNFTIPEETSKLLLRPEWVLTTGNSRILATLWIAAVLTAALLLFLHKMVSSLLGEGSRFRSTLLTFPRASSRHGRFRIASTLANLLGSHPPIVLFLSALSSWTVTLLSSTNLISIWLLHKMGIFGFLIVLIITITFSIFPLLAFIYLLMRSLLELRREDDHFTFAKLEEVLTKESEKARESPIREVLDIRRLVRMMLDILSKNTKVEGKDPNDLYVRFFGALARKASEVSGGPFGRNGLMFRHQSFLSLVGLVYAMLLLYLINRTLGAGFLSRTFVIFTVIIAVFPFLPMVFKVISLPVSGIFIKQRTRRSEPVPRRGSIPYSRTHHESSALWNNFPLLSALIPALAIDLYILSTMELELTWMLVFFLPVINLLIFHYVSRGLSSLPDGIRGDVVKMHLVLLWVFFLFDVIHPILTSLWWVVATGTSGIAGKDSITVYSKLLPFLFTQTIIEQLVLLTLITLLIVVMYLTVGKHLKLIVWLTVSSIFYYVAYSVLNSLDTKILSIDSNAPPLIDPILPVSLFFVFFAMFVHGFGESETRSEPWKIAFIVAASSLFLPSLLYILSSQNWIFHLSFILILLISGFYTGLKVYRRELPRFLVQEAESILILLGEVYGLVLTPLMIDDTKTSYDVAAISPPYISMRVDPECGYH